MGDTFKYGIDSLSISKALQLSSGKQKGIIDKAAQQKIIQSQRYVQQIVENHETGIPIPGNDAGGWWRSRHRASVP